MQPSHGGSLLLPKLFSLDDYLPILVLYSRNFGIELVNGVKFCTALLSM
jgi:hypothetical protein